MGNEYQCLIFPDGISFDDGFSQLFLFFVQSMKRLVQNEQVGVFDESTD